MNRTLTGYIALAHGQPTEWGGSLYRTERARDEAVIYCLLFGDQSGREIAKSPRPTARDLRALIDAGMLRATRAEAISDCHDIDGDEPDGTQYVPRAVLAIAVADLVECWQAATTAGKE